MQRYWYIAILAPITMIAEVFIDLQLPKLMSTIVDEGVLKGNLDLVVRTGILMILLSILGGISGILAAAFGSIASQNFGNDVRCDTYRRVMSLSPQQTDKFTTGSLVTRITNDIQQVQMFMNFLLRMFVRSPMFFIGGIIMMLGLNLSFAAVVAISLPIMLIGIAMIVMRTNPMFKVVQEKLDKLNSVVMENVTGSRVVKAYVREDHEIKRFGKANDELCDTNLRVHMILAFMSPIIMIVMNVSVIAIIYIGGLQTQARAMKVGDVMAAVTYVTQILFSIMMITMMFQMISRATASAGRISEVLDTEPVIKGGDKVLEGEINEIEFKNVSFRYPGTSGDDILKDVDFKLKKGETAAILGSTGSGKTTLVSLIARYYDVCSGEILINGVNVKEYTLSSLRDKIGYVLQKSELFSGTIEENIKWGDESADLEQVRKCASIAQADDFIMGFNDDYNTIIGEKGASLSGGQKQRISIARSIMKKPEVLIFDDSTSALDLGTEARLHSALRENLSETTVIMIAQRIASVRNCDRIFVLDGGRIVGSGTHDELLSGNEVYIDIYNSQLSKE
ncbi:MAG: ABC transporter ATP-binding protein [Clostridia bacterium]|nr:ABC transporter ATP-binding protein [Clostridia bacterium]